jgi:ribosomal-protein-alanine N-acetyltransferase
MSIATAPENAIRITLLEQEADEELCAQLMTTSEPWLTLGRSYEASLRVIRDDTREVYGAYEGRRLVGFLILCMTGVFVGFIQTVLVHPERRGKGLGSRLLQFAEHRIFRDSPNIFMCVSSFNHDARRLYERLGYSAVGELTDYIVAGYSEVLLRKTAGPLADFCPPRNGGERECEGGSNMGEKT